MSADGLQHQDGGRVASSAGRPAHPAQRKVTIEDVARAAGVGRQTVSNVLNGSGRVGAAARARVLEKVAQLGYQPHQGARSLRSRRTMQLAYLMPPIQLQPTNLIMMQFLQGLLKAAAERHYRVLVVAQEADPSADIRSLVAGRIVDAFVLSDLHPGDRRVELLGELGVPFACMGRTSQGQPQHWVDIDNAEAEAEAVRYVLDQGYNRLGYVEYASEAYWDAERRAGFRAGLASRGIPGDGAGLLRIDEDASAASARAKIRSFLSAARPDAVLTGSDRIAITVYSVAAELNLSPGRDLAVVGFDGSASAELMHPTLASVVLPVEDIARRVVGRALLQVENGQDGGPGEIVPGRLRLGGSILPLPSRSRSAAGASDHVIPL
jgi:DNA-binding LacI/PurR family transcriptional regulator